jgi:hypothetical protein
MVFQKILQLKFLMHLTKIYEINNPRTNLMGVTHVAQGWTNRIKGLMDEFTKNAQHFEDNATSESIGYIKSILPEDPEIAVDLTMSWDKFAKEFLNKDAFIYENGTIKLNFLASLHSRIQW